MGVFGEGVVSDGAVSDGVVSDGVWLVMGWLVMGWLLVHGISLLRDSFPHLEARYAGVRIPARSVRLVAFNMS